MAVCARISAFDAFAGPNANNGVCFRLIFDKDGADGLGWSIRESTTVLASGKLKAAAGKGGAAAWHSLSLTVAGSAVVAKIDAVVVGRGTKVATATHGSTSLGSSYSSAFFDNLTISNATVLPNFETL